MWRSPGAAIVLSVSSLAIAPAKADSTGAIRFDRTPWPITIVGTGFINGARDIDVFPGPNRRDVIHDNGGTDIACPRGIDDDRSSGSGDDLVNGNDGTDAISGENGADDACNGGRGPDADTADNTRKFMIAIP